MKPQLKDASEVVLKGIRQALDPLRQHPEGRGNSAQARGVFRRLPALHNACQGAEMACNLVEDCHDRSFILGHGLVLSLSRSVHNTRMLHWPKYNEGA